jgi:hypothetical protein
MKSNLLYLLALLFIMAGCSGANNDPEPEKTYLLQRKLSEVTFPTGGGLTIDLTYSYNDLGQLVRISGVTVRDSEVQPTNTTLFYDSKGRLEQVKNMHGTVWTNTYNDKNQVVQMIRQYKDSDSYYYLYSYNGKSQLTEVKTYQKEIGAATFVGSTVYSYFDGNKISIKRTSVSGENNREHALVTDDKKRELPVLPHQIAPDFFAAELFAESILTRHNIISNEVMDVATNRKNGVSYQAVYTYNEGGYPATCMKLFDQGSVEKVSYIYTSK